MEVGGKILTGAVATALLGIVAHYATAENFVGQLEDKSKAELSAQGIEGVELQFKRDPLSRVAILDGDLDDAAKQKALAAVAAIPGVADARWAGDEDLADSAGEDNAADPETAAAVSQCQQGVDAAIEGKKLSFRSGSAWISRASDEILDEVAAAFKPCSGLAIAVGGHTDSAGNAEVNRILSQERADRVRAGLIERGIAENLVSATGYGADQPLATGGGAEAAAQNRRIEFKVVPVGTTANDDAQPQQGE